MRFGLYTIREMDYNYIQNFVIICRQEVVNTMDKRKRKAVKQPAREKKVRAPRVKNPDNRRAAMWLWLLPVGLPKLWSPRCTWHKGVKLGITAAWVAVLIAVLVLPTPASRRASGGVRLVGSNPEVEVYGPELPAFIVPGYTRDQTDSVLAEDNSQEIHYVYAADGAKCYHEYDCKFAFASSQRLTVYEAYYLGFTPCGRCKPPVYEGP